MQVTNPGVNITEECKIMFASSFLSETAAIWWFTLVQTNMIPTTWQDFKQSLLGEFLPEDHVRRARDRLKRARQTSFVAKYISEFRNIILTVPDLTEGEKFDRFIDGLKSSIRLEVMKTTVNTFEEATKIALRVDSALWKEKSAEKGGFYNSRGQRGGASSSSDPSPMEIGNIQGRNRKTLTDEEKRQRIIDRQNNACYRCHKKNCRPYKCRPFVTNNAEIENNNRSEAEIQAEADLSDSDLSGSEN